MTSVLMPHPCGVNGCRISVGGDYLFCSRHWRMVPHQLRRQVLDAFDDWKRRPDDLALALTLREAQAAARKALQ